MSEELEPIELEDDALEGASGGVCVDGVEYAAVKSFFSCLDRAKYAPDDRDHRDYYMCEHCLNFYNNPGSISSGYCKALVVTK